MHKLLKSLSETNSSIEKTNILKKYVNDADIKRLFWWALNPYKQFYIKKIAPINAIGSKNIERSIDKFIELLTALSDRTLSGNIAKEILKNLLSECTLDTKDFYTRVIMKDLKCGTGSTIAERVWSKFLPEFKVQLANKYDPVKKYKVDHWWASPKLDGIRCVYNNDEKTLLSRQGKPIVGFDHIINELTVLCDNECVSICDGELYTQGIPFQTLQEYIVKQKEFDPTDKLKIKYNIFYINEYDLSHPSWTLTAEMIDTLHKIFTNTIFEHIREVPYTKINNTKIDIETQTRTYVNQGYEGAMLRDPKIPYDDKRSNALLKFKFFQEADFEVVKCKEGQGELTGTLGAIMVSGIVDKISIVSDVGSGFTDFQRNAIWQDQKSYIGKTVEIKYQNITDAPDVDGDYSLRFPVFLKFKEA